MDRLSVTSSTCAVSRPSMKILPEVGGISRLIIFMVVVLPQPEGPSKTHTAPVGTSMSTRSTAVIVPKIFVTRSRRIISIPQTGRGQTPLQSEKRQVGENGEDADRQRARDELANIRLGNAPGDEGAEPTGADIGGDRRDRDVQDDR